MLIRKKVVWFSSILVLAMMLFILPGIKAGAAEKFIDNPHWIESQPSDVNAKYNSGDKFIVMFYRPGCAYCCSLKAMLNKWMTDYNFDIYGVNIDTEYIPDWAFSASYKGSNNTPYICLVDKGAVTAGFRGDILGETLANGFSDFQGVSISLDSWAPVQENETVDVIIEAENRQSEAREVFDAVNAYRRENGKPEFKYNYNLEKDAIKRAVEYAVLKSISVAPDGRIPNEVLYAKGVYQIKTALESKEDIEDELTGKGFFQTIDTLTDSFDSMAIGYIRTHMYDYWVIFMCLSENAGEYTEPEFGIHYYTVPTTKKWIKEAKVYVDKDKASKIYEGSIFDPKDCISQCSIAIKGENPYGDNSGSPSWVIVDSIPVFTGADGKNIIYENGSFKAAEKGNGMVYGTLCGIDVSFELEVKEDNSKVPEQITNNTVTVGKPVIKVKAGTTGNSVKLTISKTNGARYYNVYMMKTSGKNKTKKYKLVSTVKKDGTKKRTVTIKNLSAGTYKFKVEAVGEETDALGIVTHVKKKSKVKKVVL